MASEFQGQFQEALREAELDELRKQAEKLSSEVTAAATNPLEKTTAELQAMIDAPEKPAAETEAQPVPETPVESVSTGPPAEPTDQPAPSDPAPGDKGRAA
jgi:sec-independent protein translocase protein TatB